MSTRSHELLLLPSLRAAQGRNGSMVLTQKYIEGAEEYARVWPGPVTSLVRRTSRPGTDMDHREYTPDGGPTALEWRPPVGPELRERLSKAAMVVLFLAPREEPTARLCLELGVPCVCVTEYTPTTELQILRAEVSNPLLRLRRGLWLRGAERARQRMLPMLAGLQCSGAPSFDHYGPRCENPMIFFDNRVRAADVMDDAALEEKLAYLDRQAPLRLVFGGRWVAMKGVMDLPEVAAALRAKGVPFSLSIYGGGPLEQDLRNRIAQLDLGAQVHLAGAMDFRSEWIPLLKREADLFLCCHPQGDPSSTYPEVMSCGVPIVGFDNEAFTGIVRYARSGWVSPMGDVAHLAAQIARLSQARDEIAQAARTARAFAQEHAFERTFERRAAHFTAVSRLPDPLKAQVATHSAS